MEGYQGEQAGWLAAGADEPTGTSMSDLGKRTNFNPSKGAWSFKAMRAIGALPIGTEGSSKQILDLIAPTVGKPDNNNTGWFFQLCVKEGLLKKGPIKRYKRDAPSKSGCWYDRKPTYTR